MPPTQRLTISRPNYPAAWLTTRENLDLIPIARERPTTSDEVAGEFHHTGLVWWISLDDEQTKKLCQAMSVAAAIANLVPVPAIAPAIAGALEAGKEYIEWTNKWGGNNGVDINGVAGVQGLIVTPRVGGLYHQLITAGRLGVSGRTIIDYLLWAGSKVPIIASTLNIPVAAAIFAAVQSGTPWGWAVSIAVGAAAQMVGAEPDGNEHGAVLADRNVIGPWESFILAEVAPGKTVSLLSWQGVFSAQNGGGAGVYANRPHVKDWETWTLVDNNDGTVSFRTFNGHYLCAEEGGGRECQANRTAIGNWEKFYLVSLSDGKVALKTRDRGKFVSVQS